MIYVILLEPETAGNVGAIARVMKNFGFENLVLVHPHCDHLSSEARNRAKHSQEILENADVDEFFVVDDYDYLIATTAKLGTDYNISRSPLTPSELAAKVKDIGTRKKIGLVIGRESHGLFNEEIAKCDFIVTIPSTKGYSTLNISHAVAVMLYELHKVIGKDKVDAHINPIGKSEKDQIHKMFVELYDKLKWQTPEKRRTQVTLWRRILGKAMLTKREAYGVMGLLRKLVGPEKVMRKPVREKTVREKSKKAVKKKPKTVKRKPAKVVNKKPAKKALKKTVKKAKQNASKKIVKKTQ